MNILKDVLSELFSMFVADARLTASILAIIAVVALLIHQTSLSPLLGGVFLLIGCVAVLFISVRREARFKTSRARENR
jgi:Ca2+/Na+ antiporter